MNLFRAPQYTSLDFHGGESTNIFTPRSAKIHSSDGQMLAKSLLIRHRKMWYPSVALFEKYLTMGFSGPVQDEVREIYTPLSEQNKDNQCSIQKPSNAVQINTTSIFVASFCYADFGTWKSRLVT